MTAQAQSALRTVEDETRRYLASDAFASTHPQVTANLDAAFELLATEKIDNDVIGAVGNHLRDALLDAINGLTGPPPPGEDHPLLRLRDHVSSLGLATREAKVATAVVDLVRSSLRLDHRLNFVRDEPRHGEPEIVWDEMRRAAFASALACYELGKLEERFT